MIAMNKRQLRKYLRSLDEGPQERAIQSAGICRSILSSQAYADASVIGGYMPLSHEADITSVIEDVLQKGKTLALPLCETAPNMTFRLVSSLNELEEGAYGILEPRRTAPIIPANKLALLLVPLEGIDVDGFRLGKGGGYYDRLLAECHVKTIGCAFTWQQVDSVPRDEWDKPLSACANCNGMHVYNR